MKLKLSAIRPVAMVTGLLSATIVCTYPLTASADQSNQTREEAIDRQTDWFLHQVNPELQGRKLRSNDYGYIRQWKMIRAAVAQEMKPTISSCGGDQYWELFDYDGINGLPSGRRGSRSFDRIADAIFYSRHPELAGTPISASNSALAREWSAIRRAIMVEQPCS
jgi:hypothetical protein